jgi:NAD(P)-dependent dehydrogenase (short-subunit alcohol dehydrogenase family)
MTSRTWFITGVSSGFGRNMTQQLLARGDRVAGTVRNLSAMEDFRTVIRGGKAWANRRSRGGAARLQAWRPPSSPIEKSDTAYVALRAVPAFAGFSDKLVSKEAEISPLSPQNCC